MKKIYEYNLTKDQYPFPTESCEKCHAEVFENGKNSPQIVIVHEFVGGAMLNVTGIIDEINPERGCVILLIYQPKALACVTDFELPSELLEKLAELFPHLLPITNS